MGEELIYELGLNPKLVVLGIGIAMGLPNILKKYGKLKGYANLLPVGACALILGFLFGMPDGMSVLSYFFTISIGAIAAWETWKIQSHKKAESKKKE